MNLYQINNEFTEILDDLYDEQGEINETALAKLETNELALEKKAIAIASYIQNLHAEREAIKSAKQAMTDREKRYQRRADELEGYLLANMERRGLSQVKCPYFDIKLKKCPPSVDITDMDAVPEEYRRVKTEWAPDKVKIKEEMLMGVIIPGAQLKTNLRLEIK